MKRSLFLFTIILLPISSPLYSQSETEVIEQGSVEMSVDTLSKDFFKLVMSPSRLTLSVKDKDSLDKAVIQLAKNKKSIDDLIDKLNKLAVPSKEKRAEIDDRFTKKELELRDTVGKKFVKHLETMPDELKSEWSKEIQSFYKSLDNNKDLFEKYFSKGE